MNRAPRLLVLQHLDVEHPGIFREFLQHDGIPWDVVELDRGEPIPALEAYAGLWVMGGPMDVWEEPALPWLVAEKAAIRRAVVDLELPYLGICLGHQLLAAALGGEVARGEPEVGIMPIELTAEGRQSAYFAGMPSTMNCLQWHGAEVTALPSGARVMARSSACAIQSMAFGSHALSAQFHVEVTPTTVPEWSAVPAYARALDTALGSGAVTAFQAAVDDGMSEFNHHAKMFYDNWMHTVGTFAKRPGAVGIHD